MQPHQKRYKMAAAAALLHVADTLKKLEKRAEWTSNVAVEVALGLQEMRYRLTEAATKAMGLEVICRKCADQRKPADHHTERPS